MEQEKKDQETIKCAYCRKEVPKDQTITRKIWVNRGTRMETFCSGECAGNYQMGCEG